MIFILPYYALCNIMPLVKLMRVQSTKIFSIFFENSFYTVDCSHDFRQAYYMHLQPNIYSTVSSVGIICNDKLPTK
jgi:hypothetical protein